jgi:branched-chain amino acid transport system permease protein
LAGAAAGAILAVLLDQAVFRLLRWRGSSWEQAPFIASLGALVILRSLALTVTNGESWSFPRNIVPIGTIDLAGIRLSSQLGIALIGSLTMMVLLQALLRGTKFGKAIRGVADHVALARLQGVKSESVYIQASALGGALAGVAGVLIGNLYNQVSPDMGDVFLLKSIIIVVLGGLGSLFGAVVGGLILGVVEVLTVYYFGGQWRDIVVFGLLLCVLLIRPQGLFARAERLRA